MKTIKNITLTILLCISYNTISTAQNLQLMPTIQRDTLLIAIAREVVLIHGPDYYREYKEPLIEQRTIPQRGEENPDGINAGRVLYVVTFLYDKIQETLEQGYAARVAIWGDNGNPANVFFGNGFGYGLPENKLRSFNETVDAMPYQQARPMPIYDFNDLDPKQVPKNINELTRAGYIRDNNGLWHKTRPDTPPADAQRIIRRAQDDMRRRQANRDRR
jgi:hypothetical protein